MSQQRFAVRTVAVALLMIAPLWTSGAGASSPLNVAINDASNGRTISVPTGTHITLMLHSTYWRLSALPQQGSLAIAGRVRTVGAPPATSKCVPGQECGTVTAHYVATGAGVERLRATRTTCGEALACSPSQGRWTITIRVR